MCVSELQERMTLEELVGWHAFMTLQQEHQGRGEGHPGRLEQQGGIQLVKGPAVGLRLAMGLDALDRIHPGGDVGDGVQGQHQRHRRDRIEIALQPEGAQRHIGEIEAHPHQIEGGPDGHEPVPVPPQAVSGPGQDLMPARACHRERDRRMRA